MLPNSFAQELAVCCVEGQLGQSSLFRWSTTCHCLWFVSIQRLHNSRRWNVMFLWLWVTQCCTWNKVKQNQSTLSVTQVLPTSSWRSRDLLQSMLSCNMRESLWDFIQSETWTAVHLNRNSAKVIAIQRKTSSKVSITSSGNEPATTLPQQKMTLST